MACTATVEFPPTPASSGLHIITRAFVFITGQCRAVDSIPHRPVGDTVLSRTSTRSPSSANTSHQQFERAKDTQLPSAARCRQFHHIAPAPGNVRCSREQHAVSTASSIAAAAHQTPTSAVRVYPWNNSCGSSIPDPALFPARTHIASSELQCRTTRISMLFNIAHTSAQDG